MALYRRALTVLAAAAMVATSAVGSAAAGDAGSTASRKQRAEGASASAKQRDPVPLYELTTQGGGTFYTLKPTEARQAVQRYGFTRAPGYLAYLDREPTLGSQALYRLRSTGPGGGYLVSGSKAERDRLVDSGRFVSEGLLGYGTAKRQPGMVALHRLSRDNTWRLARGSDVAALEDGGWRDDGVLTWAEPEHLRAGAIYFGSFDKQSSMIMKATKNVYGRSGDWWGGVRDYASPGTTGHDADEYLAYWKSQAPQHADFSDRKPAIGFYDDTKPATLEKQITQATGAGLDFFSFYWYWDADEHRQILDGGLDTFLKAKNRADMDFMVTLCASSPEPGNDLHVPSADFDAAAQSLVDKYLNQPNYLRDNEGRPIVQLCDHRGIGDAEADTPEQSAQVVQFENLLRAKAKDQLGEDLLILGNDNLMRSSSQGENGLIDRLQLDGTACLGIFYGKGAKSYHGYMDKSRANMAVAPQTFGHCAQADFDERPRYPILYGPDSLDQVRYFTDSSPKLYGEELDAVHSDIARSQRISSIDNFVWLYAWNEWHEGGYLEPNAATGCATLDLTQEHLHLDGPGCVARPTLGASR